MSLVTDPMQTLNQAEWQPLAEAHYARAAVYTAGPRLRREHNKPHPVEDFLFDYYPYPIALLEQWHPGMDVVLKITDPETIPPQFRNRRYRMTDDRVFLDVSLMDEKERLRLEWISSLLRATQDRAPHFACHGLHEWAMVYRSQEIRHGRIAALRLPQEQIDALVESRPITCTHFDAFRFFAESAKPLNRITPSLDTRHENEQPGCVHANMDLYKWAAKSMPWIGSDLLLETFCLAIGLRDLDMRASPYDLSAWNVIPIRIETPEGRKTYEILQRDFAQHASILRSRLISKLRRILDR